VFARSDKREIKIRDHDQVEQLLRHLGMIIEHADEGIVVVDRKGIIHFANTAWARMHSYADSRGILGRHIGAFQKKSMGNDIVSFMEEARRRGELVRTADNTRKDGTKFPAEMKITTIKEKNGNAIGLIIFATDITEQRQAQEEITRLREQLGQPADRFSAEPAEGKQQLESEIENLKQVEDVVLETVDEEAGPEGELQLLDEDKLRSLAELARRLS
jgi:PAS domain S-box-containing protein